MLWLFTSGTISGPLPFSDQKLYKFGSLTPIPLDLSHRKYPNVVSHTVYYSGITSTSQPTRVAYNSRFRTACTNLAMMLWHF